MTPLGARRAAPAALIAALATSCAGATTGSSRPAAAPEKVEDARAVEAEFERVEADALDWLAASDPRLAAREHAAPSEDVVKRVGMDAILAEDADAAIRGTSLDLFAFRARGHALKEAAARVTAFGERAPEVAPPGSAIARPRLERELLSRLIDEEVARAGDEAKLGEASGDLVRAILATWTPPATPQEWPDRDVWVSKRLDQMRDSLRGLALTGSPDLDVALYPLERLLAPLQFPKATAAIAALRIGLDEAMHAVPTLVTPERVAREAKVHLGATFDTATLGPRFVRVEARLRERALRVLAASGDGRPAIEARARELLLVEGDCPAPAATRVRSMAPPPERAKVCGIVRALAEDAAHDAALVAVHDDVMLALAAVVTAPPPRTGLLSHPEDDAVDSLRRASRERPIPAIGVALAAELVFAEGVPDDAADARARAWAALGDAPLDVVAREIAPDAR